MTSHKHITRAKFNIGKTRHWFILTSFLPPYLLTCIQMTLPKVWQIKAGDLFDRSDAALQSYRKPIWNSARVNTSRERRGKVPWLTNWWGADWKRKKERKNWDGNKIRVCIIQSSRILLFNQFSRRRTTPQRKWSWHWWWWCRYCWGWRLRCWCYWWWSRL